MHKKTAKHKKRVAEIDRVGRLKLRGILGCFWGGSRGRV